MTDRGPTGTASTPAACHFYLDCAPGLAFVVDLDGRVQGVNAEWERVLGFPEDALRGAPLEELLHPDDRPALEIALTQLRAGARVSVNEGRFLRKDDAPRRLLWSASPHLDRGVIFGGAHDVTDLYGRLRRFETLAHSTPDFIGFADMTGAVTYVNPAGMAMVGRAGEDYRKLTIADFRTEWGARHSREVIRPTALRDGLWVGESELQHHGDGRPIPVSQVFFVVYDDSGKPAEFASVSRDLTWRRRADALEEALRVMSVPILQVWDGVLALPILGVLDSARAARATEALLETISRTGCEVAILDLTGVEAIDSSTMSHLSRMISAASLLGSLCVVSGVSPAVAQTATQMGLDLASLRAFRSLREGLRFAMAHLGRR